jgi:uncharacterized protein (TIGR03086 family)
MTTDDELRDAMARAMTGFAAVVADVDDDDWDRASMCDGWTIRDVVEHVVGGDRFAPIILGGGTLDEAIEAVVGVDHLGDDPIGAVADAAASTRAAFADSLDRLVDHPVGSIPARRFIGFRVFDQLGHTWDIAAALGRPVELDPVAVQVALDVAEAEREMLDASTHFAMPPSIDADDGDPQATFLRTIGRTP